MEPEITESTVRAPSGPPLYSHQGWAPAWYKNRLSMPVVISERQTDAAVMSEGTNQKLARRRYQKCRIFMRISFPKSGPQLLLWLRLLNPPYESEYSTDFLSVKEIH
jgi:hypothetical protein